MKKVLIIFLVLLIFPFISALEFDMKSNFNQGETLLAKLSGNFVDPISKDNIAFYRGHVRVPFEFDIVKIENEFYIYASLIPKSPNDYSIALEDVRYYKQGQLTDEPIINNFTIIEEFADFSIDLGFVVTQEDFFIEVQNLQDVPITIQINKLTNPSGGDEDGGFLDFLFGNLFMGLTGSAVFNIDEENTLELGPGEIERIDFEIGEIFEPTFKIITLNTENLVYEIPVYLPIVRSEPEETVAMDFEPSTLNINLPYNTTQKKVVTLRNLKNTFLENITFEFSSEFEPYIDVSVNGFDNLNPNETAEIELIFSSDINANFKLEGEFMAVIPNETEYLFITINFMKDNTLPSTEIPDGIVDEISGKIPDSSALVDISGETEVSLKSKNCAEINGSLYDKNQKCLGETRYTKDGNCCVGELQQIKVSNTGKIIGWSLIVIILLFLFWFFKVKYKGAKKEINFSKIAKGKK